MKNEDENAQSKSYRDEYKFPDDIKHLQGNEAGFLRFVRFEVPEGQKEMPIGKIKSVVIADMQSTPGFALDLVSAIKSEPELLLFLKTVIDAAEATAFSETIDKIMDSFKMTDKKECQCPKCVARRKNADA